MDGPAQLARGLYCPARGKVYLAVIACSGGYCGLRYSMVWLP
jgi:hypothetical protein